MFIHKEIYNKIFHQPLFQLDLSGGKGILLIHNLLWVVGFTMIITAVGYALGLYDETENKKDFKIPKDVIYIFFIGLAIFLASFYVPIPIVRQ
ncbi:hypothetical protein GW933_02140 [Candidatus Falkowbacteria bacterium]|uniref:Uncharacterized protein n=1 Tax=Candidatus Buchananbacteria bacterium CG10_big_fil_rev_8_21_14_0_10_33_19 TaxID=1974525 RepID=A0A2H0W451_9BACT|nr:hypothetical protein [Candidatus Falkowbacteria bacterium]PIS06047.1 MAG: hypothetical protein COT80_04760 [Candidatus Buchananbacteria bacterium CG10_big_fil_rev_8_21_14_0_10_33_19]